MVVRKGTLKIYAGGNMASYDLLGNLDSSLEYFLVCLCAAAKPQRLENCCIYKGAEMEGQKQIYLYSVLFISLHVFNWHSAPSPIFCCR